MKTLLLEQLAFKTPFVVSLSNHEQSFDRLRTNELGSIFGTKDNGDKARVEERIRNLRQTDDPN